MDSPLKLEINVNIRTDVYGTVAYTFKAERSLMEHSLKEVENKLKSATMIIVDELEHATFLKGHLHQRASAAAHVAEQMEADKAKGIGSEAEPVPF